MKKFFPTTLGALTLMVSAPSEARRPTRVQCRQACSEYLYDCRVPGTDAYEVSRGRFRACRFTVVGSCRRYGLEWCDTRREPVTTTTTTLPPNGVSLSVISVTPPFTGYPQYAGTKIQIRACALGNAQGVDLDRKSVV